MPERATKARAARLKRLAISAVLRGGDARVNRLALPVGQLARVQRARGLPRQCDNHVLTRQGRRPCQRSHSLRAFSYLATQFRT